MKKIISFNNSTVLSVDALDHIEEKIFSLFDKALTDEKTKKTKNSLNDFYNLFADERYQKAINSKHFCLNENLLAKYFHEKKYVKINRIINRDYKRLKLNK